MDARQEHVDHGDEGYGQRIKAGYAYVLCAETTGGADAEGVVDGVEWPHSGKHVKQE